MKVIEILTFNRELLENLDRNNIKVSDVKYLQLYRDYTRLKAEHCKITYIIAYLSDIYNIGERTIYKIIKQFNQDCKI